MPIRLKGELVTSLSPQDLCNVLGIVKSTLLRWERGGRIPNPSRTQTPREYAENDIIAVLKYMAQINCGNPKFPERLAPMYPKVAELDLGASTIAIGTLVLTKATQ